MSMYDIYCRSNAVDILPNMQQNNNNNNNINSGEIVIAKFNYNSQENHELTITKNERLILLDDTCLWWKVKRVDSDDTGYIPSNFARREKRSLLDKIISKRITKKQIITNGYNNNNDRSISLALVKFRYDAESEDEISLNKGIWVNVLQKKSDGWWLVQYEKQRGWFPSNYLIEKTSDSLNSLSLLNQLNNQNNSPTSLSSNGLSSSSSANSNLIDHQNLQQIRHNSHPLHITNSNDDYAFVIKPSKFAHSDGRLDTCNNNLNDEPKINSCSALIQHHDNNPIDINDDFKKLILNNSSYINEVWYYGLLSRDEAEKYLKLYGNEKGDFLVRNSERRIGNYSLSIRDNEDMIRHFRIELSNDGNRYIIGKRSFKSLNHLIEHYKTHPVFDADQNNKLYLNKPLILNDTNHQS